MTSHPYQIQNRHIRLKYGLTLIICGLSLGWANTWDGIKGSQVKIVAVKAQFTQEKHLKILKKPLVSKGVFIFQTPDSLRWEYTAPVKSVLLMNKGSIKRFIAGSNGFREDTNPALPMMQQVLQEMTQWLEGRFDENNDFIASLKPGPVIELVPKKESVAKMIQRIELSLADRPGVIRSVTIFEGQGAYTRFVFSDVLLNQPIESSVFQKL